MCFWSLLWSWQKDVNRRLRICFVSRSDTSTRTIATWAETSPVVACVCGKSGWALGSIDLVAWTVLCFVKNDVLDADLSRFRGFRRSVAFRTYAGPGHALGRPSPILDCLVGGGIALSAQTWCDETFAGGGIWAWSGYLVGDEHRSPVLDRDCRGTWLAGGSTAAPTPASTFCSGAQLFCISGERSLNPL